MMSLLVAHRGASFEAPENTLAAVRLGFAQGADAVETDVHLSKDERIIVMHDDNTWRTARHVALIAAQTLDEIQKLDADGWKDARFEGERVPSLEEVLAVVPPEKRLLVEVKCGPKSSLCLREYSHAR
jgi:glycerophosphoryl diester phosphodiesterase